MLGLPLDAVSPVEETWHQGWGFGAPCAAAVGFARAGVAPVAATDTRPEYAAYTTPRGVFQCPAS